MAVTELYNPWTDVLKRELSEELGDGFQCLIYPEPVIIFPHFVEKDSMPAVGIGYYAVPGGQQNTIRLSDEHTEYEWVSAFRYPGRIGFESTMADALDRFLSAYKTEKYASIHQFLLEQS